MTTQGELILTGTEDRLALSLEVNGFLWKHLNPKPYSVSGYGILLWMVNSCIPRLLAYPSIPCQRFVFSYASAPDIVRYSSESWCDRFSYIEALELSYLNFKDDKHILFIRRYRTDFLSTIYLHTCFISHSVSQSAGLSVRWPTQKACAVATQKSSFTQQEVSSQPTSLSSGQVQGPPTTALIHSEHELPIPRKIIGKYSYTYVFIILTLVTCFNFYYWPLFHR